MKIIKILINSKDKINKVSSEYNLTIQKFKSEREALEQNLTAQIEKEKALARRES